MNGIVNLVLPRKGRLGAVLFPFVLACALALLLASLVHAIDGPVATPPGGVTITPSDPSGRQIGLAGGIDYAYTDFDFSQFETLHWGAWDANGVRFAFDGVIDEGGETLGFSMANPDLANGIARWTGQSDVLIYVGSGNWDNFTYPTRFTVRVTDSSGDPIPMALASDLGIPTGGAVITVTGNFTANLLIETDPGGGWQPALLYYNNQMTHPTQDEWVLTEFLDGFFYTTAVDMGVSKKVAPLIAAPGDGITYTLSFSNSGSQLATGVFITDVVPISLTNVSYVYGGATLTETGLISYAWQVADLPIGQGGLITMTGQLVDPLPHGHVFTNTGTIVAAEPDSDSDNNSAAASITIDAQGPEPPQLLSPTNGAITDTIAVTLSWAASPSPDVAGYLIDFDGTVTNMGNATQYNTGLLPNGVYTWTVAAFDVLSNTGAYTDVWSFEVNSVLPFPPALLSPSDGTITNTTSITLEWGTSISPDVTGYWLDWDGTAMDVGSVNQYPTSELANGTYTWTVAAYDVLNTGVYTDVWSFEIDNQPPAVTLVDPADKDTGVAINAAVAITFSEAINAATFVFSAEPDPGGWSVIWSSDRTAATLNHDSFGYSVPYTMTVMAAADLAGNWLPTAYTWSFTTVPYSVYLPLLIKE